MMFSFSWSLNLEIPRAFLEALSIFFILVEREPAIPVYPWIFCENGFLCHAYLISILKLSLGTGMGSTWHAIITRFPKTSHNGNLGL